MLARDPRYKKVCSKGGHSQFASFISISFKSMIAPSAPLQAWLWERSSVPERECRRKCMALHSALASAYASAAGMQVAAACGERHRSGSTEGCCAESSYES